jgi:hypothetical protein
MLRRYIMATKKYYVVISDLISMSTEFVESGKNDPFYDGTINCAKFDAVGLFAIYSRTHTGDENGKTIYKVGMVHLADMETGEIINVGLAETLAGIKTDICYLLLTKKEEDHYKKESSSEWSAKDCYIMTGRKHNGDENGSTTIYSRKLEAHRAIIFGKDETLELKKENELISIECEESAGTEVEKEVFSKGNVSFYLPITGRTHSGDENGKTTTYFTKYYIEIEVDDK